MNVKELVECSKPISANDMLQCKFDSYFLMNPTKSGFEDAIHLYIVSVIKGRTKIYEIEKTEATIMRVKDISVSSISRRWNYRTITKLSYLKFINRMIDGSFQAGGISWL